MGEDVILYFTLPKIKKKYLEVFLKDIIAIKLWVRKINIRGNQPVLQHSAGVLGLSVEGPSLNRQVPSLVARKGSIRGE